MYELSPFHFSYGIRGQTRSLTLKTSLTFKAGESILITGPSGGGKSTFLKILKGLIPEYSSGKLEGQVLYKGKKLYGPEFEENLKNILYLFQNPFSQIIYPETEEEFFFSMENMNFSREEMDRQKQLFETQFNLKNLWNKKTNQLSHGECQRLVFSSLLAIAPEVLLLDEPTAFVDPKARHEFYELLHRSLAGKLLILVDHHLEEVLPLVTRVIQVDERGEISEIDKADVQTARPSDLPVLNINWESFKGKKARIELDDVGFGYNGAMVLQSVSATFNSGEIIVVRGENGAGKSTLFKLIAGILKPQKGQLRLFVNEQKISPSKIFKETGFIFQNPETHFFFDTILEELNFSLKLLNPPDKRREIINAFFSELDLNKSPFVLSEGEKRRLSLLMTVFCRKSIYLYDEPTFGQDEKSRQLIAQLLKSLKNQDTIQIVISHDEEFIQSVADRVFTLRDGRLIES